MANKFSSSGKLTGWNVFFPITRGLFAFLFLLITLCFILFIGGCEFSGDSADFIRDISKYEKIVHSRSFDQPYLKWFPAKIPQDCEVLSFLYWRGIQAPPYCVLRLKLKDREFGKTVDELNREPKVKGKWTKRSDIERFLPLYIDDGTNLVSFPEGFEFFIVNPELGKASYDAYAGVAISRERHEIVYFVH